MGLPKPYFEDIRAGIVIYHARNEDIIPHLTERYDLLMADPPYGIKVDVDMHKQSGQQYGNAAAPKSIYSKTDWDSAPATKEALESMRALAKWSIIWGGNYFELPPARCWLIWSKLTGTNNFADAEMAWTNLDKPVRLKEHMWNGMLRKNGELRLGHPTQKPLEVISWAILEAPRDIKSVFDPYMGSGTTARACKDLGLRFVGIEAEEKYCAMTVDRLAQESLPLAIGTKQAEEQNLL